jgi:DNA-binding CsgD family transcriptional regulator
VPGIRRGEPAEQRIHYRHSAGQNSTVGAVTLKVPSGADGAHLGVSTLAKPQNLAAFSYERDGARHVLFSFDVATEHSPELTSAEHAVLELVLQGRSNAWIAQKRATSVNTVANQVASLLRKFGVSSRVALAAKASGFMQARAK